MKIAIISILLSIPASGAVSITVTQPITGQALLNISGCAGPNTIQLSESASLTPLHPDVDPSIYSGSNIASTRPDTYTDSGSVIHVLLGHFNGQRSLAAATTYYVKVTGCSSNASTSFSTKTIPFGNSRTEPIPFDTTKLYNIDLPPIDWSIPQQTIVEPSTAIKHITIGNTWTQFRTGGPFANSQSTFFSAIANTPGDWSNLSTITNGSTSTASTIVANSPVNLFIDTSSESFVPNFPYLVLQDIGFAVWASRTSTMTAVYDLIVHGTSCGTPITVTPTGTFGHVNSGNTNDPDQDWGTNFPTVPFRTWNPTATQPCIRQGDLTTSGNGTVSGNTLTTTVSGNYQFFSNGLKAGDRVWVNPSSCANNMCTVASFINNTTITLVETPGNGAVSFKTFSFWLSLKASGSGTLTIGTKYKIAGSQNPPGNQALGDKCSDVAVTSGDGKVGYNCFYTSEVTGAFYEYFMANDGTARPFSQRSGIVWDHSNADVMWQLANNGSGGFSVYKLTYTGNHTTSWSLNWNCTPGGCDLTQGGTDSVTSTNVMDHSTGNDLDQQIVAKQGTTLPAYDFSLYGHWNPGGAINTLSGGSGNFVFVNNVYAGQGGFGSGSGSWTAVIDITTNPAQVVDLIHTVQAVNYPMLKFGSSHSVNGAEHYNNILFLSTDPLYTNNQSTPLGGPHQAQVGAVLQNDGITWASNTTLVQMDQLGSATYLRTCPSNVYGYTECVTILLPQGGICNTSATTIEITNHPCPWSGTASQYPVLSVGDNAIDNVGTFTRSDNEHFTVLSTNQLSGTIGGINNPLEVVLARNSAYEYCSTTPWHGTTNPWSRDAYSQTAHANGWFLMGMPVGTNSTYGRAVNTCGGGVIFLNVLAKTQQNLGRIFGSHNTYDKGVTSGNFTYATNSNSIYNVPFANLGQVPYTSDIKSFAGPSFHGAGSGIDFPLQSYPEYHHSQSSNSLDFKWSLDSNNFQSAVGPPAFNTNIVHISGDVYTISPLTVMDLSTTANKIAAYKSQNLLGWAGHWLLHDITGPSTNIDTTAWGICWALIAGWCHSGSSAGILYINVPNLYNDGTGNCYNDIPLFNAPCVIIGINAPFDGIRQYRISDNDSQGVYTRVASMSIQAPGQKVIYSHATDHPSGNYFVQLGTTYQDGFIPQSWIAKTTPYDDSYTQNNDFTNINVTVSSGHGLAEVRFGYSRYGGLPNQFKCTQGSLTCITRSGDTLPGLLEVDGHNGTSCGSGCTIAIPATGPNLMSYQTFVSDDGGTTWLSTGDIVTVAVGVGAGTCSISPTSLGPWTVGQVINVNFSNLNCASSTWSSSGAFPTGLSFNTSTGILSGTISGSAGTFTPSVSYDVATNNYSIVVNAIPQITTTCPLTTGTQGVAYSQTLTSVGGTMPITWVHTSGTYQTGLSGCNNVTGTTCLISGTPTVASIVSNTFTATDSNGIVATLSSCNLTINPASSNVNNSMSGGVIAGGMFK